jgi:hypothetical protein
MKKSKYIIFVLASFLFSSCDSGDVYPDETSGRSGRLADCKMLFSGLAAWPSSDYSLVLAAYSNGGSSPVAFRRLAKPASASDTLTAFLSGIKGADYLTVAILYRNSTCIYKFFTRNIRPTDGDTVNMSLIHVNLVDFGRIKAQVFSNCVACHGGGFKAADNLYLISDSAYSNLVNRLALRSNKNRVQPGDVSQSFIIDVLQGKTPVGFHYNHTNGTLRCESEDVKLLRVWIESL